MSDTYTDVFVNDLEPVGFDFGNSICKICIRGKVAKIPTAYAIKEPHGRVLPSGFEAKVDAFSLLFDKTILWFGQDVLSGPIIQELDETKYEKFYVSVLFRAVLYEWSRRHKIDLNSLGKMNIVTSMPPGVYQDRLLYKQAESAYQKVFNRGQSHMKIRDGKHSSQIVTHFGGIERESVGSYSAAGFGKYTLVIDLGSGTNDFSLFNGSPKPIYTATDNTGFLHTYAEINRARPSQAELSLMRNNTQFPQEINIHFNEVKRKVVMLKRGLQIPIGKIIVIGGGAALMKKSPPIKAEFAKLAPLVLRDEYENSRSNWRAAGGEVMRINLNLDEKIDQEFILFLQTNASGGALSKALYLYVYKAFWAKPENEQKRTEIDRNGSISGENELELGEIGDRQNDKITEVSDEELVSQMKAWEKGF